MFRTLHRGRYLRVSKWPRNVNWEDREKLQRASAEIVPDEKNSSSEENPITEGKERERAREKRERCDQDDDDESSSYNEPESLHTKDKDELQREALEKHSRMCEAALATMEKMQGLLSKLQKKMWDK